MQVGENIQTVEEEPDTVETSYPLSDTTIIMKSEWMKRIEKLEKRVKKLEKKILVN